MNYAEIYFEKFRQILLKDSISFFKSQMQYCR